MTPTPEDEIRDVLMDAGRADLVPALFRIIDAAEHGRLTEARAAMDARWAQHQIARMNAESHDGWAARAALRRLRRNHERTVRYFLARLGLAEPVPKRDGPVPRWAAVPF